MFPHDPAQPPDIPDIRYAFSVTETRCACFAFFFSCWDAFLCHHLADLLSAHRRSRDGFATVEGHEVSFKRKGGPTAALVISTVDDIAQWASEQSAHHMTEENTAAARIMTAAFAGMPGTMRRFVI
jgi:hypothetical protein